MLQEIIVDLDALDCRRERPADEGFFGKALAVKRMIEAEDPDRTVYLSGYTPLIASGLGFAGKLNVYGVSLLGGNLQGSRSGGLIAGHMTGHGIAGIQIVGDTIDPHLLVIDVRGVPRLAPLSDYGDGFAGTSTLAAALYGTHGDQAALAVTDPSTTGFRYNAIVCNDRPGSEPHRVAGRGTTRFGRNGLAGIVVERPDGSALGPEFDRAALTGLLRGIHKSRANVGLRGSADGESPLLGGTYGAAAKTRFDFGHGLTDLFRSADVPKAFYQGLLPDTIVHDQIRLAGKKGARITRHACLPGCPNRCSQVVLFADEDGDVRAVKAGEWETYQGLINLGIFEGLVEAAAWVTAHSNEYAYDHIEGLVTCAALALATESGRDTGVRYGNLSSVKSAFEQAVRGETDLGALIREGAAAVERHCGMERHFTVGGHALPFHNGRSLVQTGIGLSWTYGRHGEVCAGPGRHNFLGEPYDPADHTLAPETHVLNTIHGMILYGALDELGMCFFLGPSIDTLVDISKILEAMGLVGDPRAMVRGAAACIRNLHVFNGARGVFIEPLPNLFYDRPTHGNAQTPDEAVAFDIPFETIRDYGAAVLEDAATGKVTIPDVVLEKSCARHP